MIPCPHSNFVDDVIYRLDFLFFHGTFHFFSLHDPALVAWRDYEQQIQVAVLNDEPTMDQIPLEAMNLF